MMDGTRPSHRCRPPQPDNIVCQRHRRVLFRDSRLPTHTHTHTAHPTTAAHRNRNRFETHVTHKASHRHTTAKYAHEAAIHCCHTPERQRRHRCFWYTDMTNINSRRHFKRTATAEAAAAQSCPSCHRHTRTQHIKHNRRRSRRHNDDDPIRSTPLCSIYFMLRAMRTQT